LEVLKRARGASDGELTSFGHNPPAGLQDELNNRTHKAGYTDRDGQQMIRRTSSAGKGDNIALRMNSKQWYSKNNPLPEKIVKLWPRDKDGNLID